MGTRAARLAVLVLAVAVPASADDLASLAGEFWAWRAVHQPFSEDDIPRLTRPLGWRADWSPAAFAARRDALVKFEARWKALEPSGRPMSQRVDHRLIGSAIARVRWELEVLRGYRRNPGFYIDQTLGAVFLPLLPPPPFDAERSAEIVRRLESIPETLAHARVNLDEARAPFAKLATLSLKDARPRLLTLARELKPYLAAESAARLDPATERAASALDAYRDWLVERLPRMATDTAVGRENYVFFLKSVALMPFTPEQILAMGRQEVERAVAFEAYEQRRNQGLPPLSLLSDQAAVVARERNDEAAVRRFLEERGILSIPAWLKHYSFAPVPAYVVPLRSLGVTDDLTGPGRLDRDAVSYFPEVSPSLGYFDLAGAHDPRTGIVHEGAHYMQLALSWAHEDEIRRHYYDSGPNEGIAFYNEEMLLQAGLFDDNPRTREIIYNMARLRALRVEVDVKLALGLFTIEQGALYLQASVPMDAETASWEAAFFATIPGQAITYQIGKLQILGFLADARRKEGEAFSLRAFHDSLWKNGNVPLALQRAEYLGEPLP
jgi:uncharacterized protein (DUF885 family)